MVEWTPAAVAPEVIAGDGEIEVAAIPFPDLGGGGQAGFFRVGVSYN